jgi:hypothetical protein
MAGRIGIVGTGVVIVALIAAGIGFGLTSSKSPRKVADPTTSTTTAAKKKPKPATAPVTSDLCPLTGMKAPHGIVPRRPALGVKIGNDPTSRPQSGLLDADIVYEEMAEGGITRYLAIFQCADPPLIGPIRSVRWDDWHVLESYGHPILSFSGGIEEWDAEVASLSWLFDANGSEGTTQNAYFRTSNRVPPWNLYSTGTMLWALDSNHTPPPPQFTYSAAPPPAAVRAVAATIVGLAAGSNVDWAWNGQLGDWMRSYDGVPDVDAAGPQLRAKNVIIDVVATRPGPYDESGTTPDTESITQGSGRALILRNGEVETGMWICAKYGDVVQYRFPNGKTMTLAPGNTWVELVPNQGYPISIQH